MSERSDDLHERMLAEDVLSAIGGEVTRTELAQALGGLALALVT